MKIFAFTLTVLLSISLYAQKQNFTNKIEKNFSVNTATNFTINTKNGNIDFEIWEKNEIQVEATFEVNTTKVEKATQFLQAFTFMVETDSNNIKITSVINDDLLDKSFRYGKSDYKINYHIKHPVYLNMNIYNRYGDVNLYELSGNLYVNLQYGKFFVKNLTSDESKNVPRFDLKYSECTILKSNWLDINADYSTVKITKALSINIHSAYSEITTDNAFSATIKSRHDKIRFTEISTLNVNASYSKFNVDLLKKDLSYVAKYAPININDLDEEFNSIWFDVNFSDINLRIPNTVCFSMNADAQYGKIYLPKRSNVNNYISSSSMKTVGTVGCLSGANAQVNAKTNYCDLNITEK